MPHPLSRRRFLAGSAAALAVPSLPRLGMAADELRLTVDSRMLHIQGKPAKVFGILQSNGTHGIVTTAGQRFKARVQNRLDEPTTLHWHGQLPPNAMDGVPGVTQKPIAAGQDFACDFGLRPGTHWMHSHQGLQQQRLLAAPMIVREPGGDDRQDVVILLHDFAFAEPAEQFAKLTGTTVEQHLKNLHGGLHGGLDMAAMHPMHISKIPSHAHDLEYDAYLANDRSLDDPQVVRVENGENVRLRIINGAATTAFTIDLGQVPGQLVAVDGSPVAPLAGSSFPIAMGQRLDITLDLPNYQGAYPILARREDDRVQTGIVLATKSAILRKVPAEGLRKSPFMSLDTEARLTALDPLAERPVDRKLTLALQGMRMGYRWMLNGQTFGHHTALEVKQGERVELTFTNHSPMMHPMHLHGHAFQVVGIGSARLQGALRDTVMVPPLQNVTIAFDAANPGEWALHCQNLFHMAAGMMTTVKYV